MRPSALHLLPVVAGVVAACSGGPSAAPTELLPAEAFGSVPGSRRWLGPGFWANRLQDWWYEEGLLKCVDESWQPLRTAHDLVHEITALDGRIEAGVGVATLDGAGDRAPDAAAGILIGVGRALDHRARAFVFSRHAIGGGLFAGVDAQGSCLLHDGETGEPLGEDAPGARALPVGVDIALTAEPSSASDARLELVVTEAGSGDELCRRVDTVPRRRLEGGFALVSHPGAERTGVNPGRFGFRGWSVSGNPVVEDLSRGLGPVVTTQYTTSRGVLKLSAQFVPIGADDPAEAQLEVRRGAEWRRAASAPVERPSLVALFRVEEWDASQEVPYRVVYDLPVAGSGSIATAFPGVVRAEPEAGQPLRLGVLGCAIHHPWGGSRDWSETVYFPHHDLVERLAAQRPDLLFFYGDQLYEGTPSPVDPAHYEEDYLYKWYLWGWSFRGLTRSVPTVTIPDDHDVYQGNLWGEGGRAMGGVASGQTDSSGGYEHPPAFVNLVHRTQTAHLPDPFDPTPIEQEISVYYTDLVYGRVSFAVLADRMFKSGPTGHGLPPSGTPRADHYNNPAFDTSSLDRPGLALLGERQLRFLEHWAGDWAGADLKLALSSSPFANLATHHGPRLDYLMADLDSNGWPQSGRDRALRVLRKARAVHVTGDQHLATVVQHGIDRHRDAVWSFTAPAISNAYARAFAPDARDGYVYPEPASVRGDRLDGFGNRITVHAVANPGRDMGSDRPRLHDQMPGFGMVIVDKAAREYGFECWPRSAQVHAGGQYRGWPISVRQQDNDGRPPFGYLPEIQVSGSARPVVRVRRGDTGELVYAQRMPESRFRLPVYRDGPHRVEIEDPDRVGAPSATVELAPASGDGEPVAVRLGPR